MLLLFDVYFLNGTKDCTKVACADITQHDLDSDHRVDLHNYQHNYSFPARVAEADIVTHAGNL